MGIKLKKVLLSVLSLSLILMTWRLTALRVLGSEVQYEIYPTPQSVTYANGEFVISREVNVVYDETIDDVTKNKVKEIFDAKGIVVNEAKEAKESVTNVLVGTNASKGYVDQYFDENIAHEDTFFDKMDAHIVFIQDKNIAILGKNTDASFYGLVTLKHILNQIEGRTIRNVRIDDFASTKTRGFIEGYYGIPWSDEDRISLMEFGGEFKMTSYIFAPKDDAYHSARWRDPYPAERLEEMKKMVEAGNNSKCRFVWTIHPFMNGGITEASYDADIEKIVAKFEQLYGIGVRQFGVLGDDAGGLPRSVVVRVMQRLQEWVDSKGDVYNLVFCPGGYNNAWWVQGELDDYDQGFDEDIQIFWTGEAVCQPVEQITLDHFKTRDLPDGAEPRRSPLFWLNWPVNDINMKRLMMGKGSLLHTDVNVNDLEGVVTNPMQEAEASKVALFAVADYAWNVKAFDDDQSWADSFKYIDDEAGDALYEMAKHLSDPSPNGHGLNLAESEELQPLLNDFRTAFDKGENMSDKGNALIAEFERIIKTCDEFNQLSKNENLKEEINPWCLSLRDISEANIELIQAIIALENDQNDEAISHYTLAVAKIEDSRSHTRLKINNQIDIAEAGAKHIIPFANYLSSELSITIGSILDPSQVIAKVITNRTDTPTGNVENLLDNNEATEVIWKNPSSTTAGTYIGVMYNQVIDIHDFTFKMGQAGNARDTFGAAKVQYSVDGKNWVDIAGSAYTDTRDLVKMEGLSIQAKGIRLVSTEDKTNMWLGCKDIVINGVKDETPVLKGTPFIEDMVVVANDQNNDSNPDLSKIVDGNTSTGLNFRETNPSAEDSSKIDQIHKNAAVGLSFDTPQILGVMKLHQAAGDKVSHAAIEYRENGLWKTFVELSDLGAEVIVNLKGIQADAIRFRNLDDNTQKWWNLTEIAVESYTGAFTMSPLYNTEIMVIRSGAINNILDNSTATNASFAKSADNADPDKDNTLVDAWVGVEFDDTIEVGNIHISNGNGSKDKINKGVIEYRINGEWKTYQTLENIPYELDVSLNGVRADAVRLRNSEKLNGWWQFNEISVERFDGTIDNSVPITKTIIKTSTFSVYSGNEANLLDGNDANGVWYRTEGNTTQVGDYLGIDLGRVADLQSFYAAVGLDNGDKWAKFDLEYSVDNTNWTTFKSYTGVASGQDIIDEDLTGIKARYVRLVNKQQKECWVKFGEIDVKENLSVPTNKYMYTNVVSLRSLQGVHSLERMSLLPTQDVTLNTGDYVGVKLERLKDLISLEVDVANGLTLQTSENGVVWTEVTNQKNVEDARYIRLINETSSPVTFDLTKFIVNSNEIYELSVSETQGFTVVEMQNLFDKDRTSETVFQGSQVQGRYVTYDLGQVIDLSTFKIVSRDSNTDFPRHAKISVSENGSAWTEIMTLGNQDGTANTGEAENTDTIQDVMPLHEISYNAKEANNLNVKARYIKFEITKSKVGADKWVRFTEFEINNNQTLATTTDPTVISTVENQQGYDITNVLDGDTSTAFKPNANEAGFLLYKVTENTQKNKITILQSPAMISNAKVYAQVIDNSRTPVRWIELARLNTTLCEYTLPASVQHLLAVKIEWNADQEVAIQEILLSKVASVTVDKSQLEALIEQAKKMDTSTWITDSKTNLQATLQYAEETKDNDYVSESIVRSAASKLDNALNHPLLKGDLSEVITLLDDLKPINNDDNLYVQTTFTKLQSTIQYVENVIKDEGNVSVDDATSLMSTLQNAQSQLVFSAIPKENLVSYVEEIRYELDLFDEELYHAETLQVLKDTLKQSQDMIDTEDTIVQAFVDQYAKIVEAHQLANYAKSLKASIEKYEVIVADSFVETTYTAFKEKLGAAKELLKTQVSSDTVQTTLKELEEAYHNLTFDMDAIAIQVEKFETDVLSAKENYTTSTITVFETTIANVKAFMEDPAADKVDFQNELAVMMSAYGDLVNIKLLNAELDAFDKTSGERFTAQSYADYEAVYQGLDIDHLKNDGTQAEVDQAVKNLEAARAALVEVATQQDIVDLINHLEAYKADDYTANSYQAVSNVLSAICAQNVWSKEEFIQISEKANEAVLGLVEVTELNKRLNANLNANDYTADSYLVLSTLLEEAKALKVDGTAEEIAELIVKIDEAIDQLVLTPESKKELAEALKEAGKIDLENYTEESVAALEKAIADAQSVYVDDHAKKIAIDQALAALQEAIKGLKEKPVTPNQPVRPSDPTKPNQPSVSEGNQTQTNTILTPNTGDDTMMNGFARMLLFAGACMIIAYKKQRKECNS